MPSRKHIKPLPKFSFVTPEFEAKEVNWLKKHSGTARSHAAYWGGSAKYRCLGNKQIIDQLDNTTTHVSSADKVSSLYEYPKLAASTKRHRRINKPKNNKALSLATESTFGIPYHIEPDTLQILCPVPSEIRATNSPFKAGLPAFKFYGEGFIKRFVMSNHEDSSIVFSSCLLLSYAHYMALTGHGTETALLKLKGQVICRISTKMKSSDGFLSPRCLTAILALGAPIVCMVSRDLPKRLSMWEYINLSAKEDCLCCSESANIAESALEEGKIHRQAMRSLFLKSNTGFQDTDSVALLQYVSNYIDISMAIEAANHLHTSLVDVRDLFPTTRLCESCSIPRHWTSPLTCQWSYETYTTNVETQMLLLAGLVHRWLATFLDGDSHGLMPTKELLEERASLHQRIERFIPMENTANDEAEAMYECCRWASLILLAVENLSIPIYVAAKYIRIKPRLVRRLRMTDLSHLWGVHRGLLFWVTATCQFSTAGQCFPLLCTTLFARFVQEIAMLDSCSEIAIKPLQRLKQFEILCCSPKLRT